MGYVRAEEILPDEIIEMIQKYVDGTNIYIPKKQHNRRRWGAKTTYQKELDERNREIFAGYLSGIKVSELAECFYLSEKSIQRIIRTMKRKKSEKCDNEST